VPNAGYEIAGPKRVMGQGRSTDLRGGDRRFSDVGLLVSPSGFSLLGIKEGDRVQSSKFRTVGMVIAAALVLALVGAPMFVFGADHLDAPNLMSPEGRTDADINDVYVFQGSNEARTVIAVTTHPAAGAIAPLKYAKDVKYKINVDQDGDAIEDLAYVWDFGKGPAGDQRYKVLQYEGENARRLTGGDRIGSGRTDRNIRLDGQGRSFAGLRSDPFFFDLDAFRHDVLGQDTMRSFCDQNGAGIDFFVELNTNGIVLEVPDGALGGDIGVWATTIGEDGQIDRMARPAINTVFNKGGKKNAFNVGAPRDDQEVFRAEVEGTLATFSALDKEGAYSDSEIDVLADVLLPDVVTYDTGTSAAGPLNGRALADDVIDAELNIVTGGFAFPGRDEAGAITTDCVGPHTDYQVTFPYLGEPH
jgi:Domain of unknown function (DUF4331)